MADTIFDIRTIYSMPGFAGVLDFLLFWALFTGLFMFALEGYAGVMKRAGKDPSKQQMKWLRVIGGVLGAMATLMIVVQGNVSLRTIAQAGILQALGGVFVGMLVYGFVKRQKIGEEQPFVALIAGFLGGVAAWGFFNYGGDVSANIFTIVIFVIMASLLWRKGWASHEDPFTGERVGARSPVQAMLDTMSGGRPTVENADKLFSMAKKTVKNYKSAAENMDAAKKGLVDAQEEAVAALGEGAAAMDVVTSVDDAQFATAAGNAKAKLKTATDKATKFVKQLTNVEAKFGKLEEAHVTFRRMISGVQQATVASAQDILEFLSHKAEDYDNIVTSKRQDVQRLSNTKNQMASTLEQLLKVRSDFDSLAKKPAENKDALVSRANQAETMLETLLRTVENAHTDTLVDVGEMVDADDASRQLSEAQARHDKEAAQRRALVEAQQAEVKKQSEKPGFMEVSKSPTVRLVGRLFGRKPKQPEPQQPGEPAQPAAQQSKASNQLSNIAIYCQQVSSDDIPGSIQAFKAMSVSLKDVAADDAQITAGEVLHATQAMDAAINKFPEIANATNSHNWLVAMNEQAAALERNVTPQTRSAFQVAVNDVKSLASDVAARLEGGTQPTPTPSPTQTPPPAPTPAPGEATPKKK